MSIGIRRASGPPSTHWPPSVVRTLDVSLGLTIVGFLLTVIGLCYAIAQIRKTESAAQAAKKAALDAIQEARRGFQKFAVAFAHRFLNEVKIHLRNQHFDRAALRLDDLATHLAQLSSPEEKWLSLQKKVRVWANSCNQRAKDETSEFAEKKLSDFLLKLESEIDRLFGPFDAYVEET